MSSTKSTDKAAEEIKEKKSGETVKTGGKPAGKKSAEAQEESKPVQKKKEQAESKTVKKTAKKSPARKTDKPELKPEVYIEYQSQQVLEEIVIEKIKAAYVAGGHRVSSIKSLQVYIKPEEFKAYYVINNGKYTGEVFLF